MRTRFSKKDLESIASTISHALDILSADYTAASDDSQEFKDQSKSIEQEIELVNDYVYMKISRKLK